MYGLGMSKNKKNWYRCQAEAFHKFRTDNGFTQNEIAKIMGLSGCQQVSNLERGKNPFPVKHYSKIKHIPGARRLFKAAVDDFKKNWIFVAEYEE